MSRWLRSDATTPPVNRLGCSRPWQGSTPQPLVTLTAAGRSRSLVLRHPSAIPSLPQDQRRPRRPPNPDSPVPQRTNDAHVVRPTPAPSPSLKGTRHKAHGFNHGNTPHNNSSPRRGDGSLRSTRRLPQIPLPHPFRVQKTTKPTTRAEALASAPRPLQGPNLPIPHSPFPIPHSPFRTPKSAFRNPHSEIRLLPHPHCFLNRFVLSKVIGRSAGSRIGPFFARVRPLL